MSVQVEKLEKNMAKLTIEVSAAEFEKALEDAFIRIRIKSVYLVFVREKYRARW